MATEYEKPRLIFLGTVKGATLASGNDGQDPCRDNPPRGPKQTGAADFIQGNANITTCSI